MSGWQGCCLHVWVWVCGWGGETETERAAATVLNARGACTQEKRTEHHTQALHSGSGTQTVSSVTPILQCIHTCLYCTNSTRYQPSPCCRICHPGIDNAATSIKNAAENSITVSDLTQVSGC